MALAAYEAEKAKFARREGDCRAELRACHDKKAYAISVRSLALAEFDGICADLNAQRAAINEGVGVLRELQGPDQPERPEAAAVAFVESRADVALLVSLAENDNKMTVVDRNQLVSFMSGIPDPVDIAQIVGILKQMGDRVQIKLDRAFRRCQKSQQQHQVDLGRFDDDIDKASRQLQELIEERRAWSVAKLRDVNRTDAQQQAQRQWHQQQESAEFERKRRKLNDSAYSRVWDSSKLVDDDRRPH